MGLRAPGELNKPLEMWTDAWGRCTNTSLRLENPSRHLFKLEGSRAVGLLCSDDLFQQVAGNIIGLSPWLW